MKLLVTLIFLGSYVLIASRRVRLLPIGRPGGALLGAIAMVSTGIITPKESYGAIDHETIALLFAMMLLSVYLDESQIFVRLSTGLIAVSRTPWRLLVGISLVAGVASAFLLNDTVCVFMTPLVVAICLRTRLPMGPYLIALGTSANIGSAATLVGNPQNILIGSMSGLGFAEFAGLAVLPSVLGLGANIALLGVFYRRRLPERIETPPAFSHDARVPTAFIDALEAQPRFPAALWVIAGVVLGFFAGFDRAYTALAGVAAMILIQRRDPRLLFARIDWPLLVFFCCLFIIVAAFARTGLVDDAWRALAPELDVSTARGLTTFTVAMSLASNLVSNVPLVMLVGPRLVEQSVDPGVWVLLGLVTTVAGNLTLVGSVANLIVAEGAREHYALGFREYLRFGVVSTVVVLALEVPVSVLVSAALDFGP